MLELITNPITVNTIAGGLGGLVRAVIGYLNRPEDEPFRPKAFIRSIIVSIIAGVSVGYTLNTHPVATFLSAVGVDLLVVEVYGAAKS